MLWGFTGVVVILMATLVLWAIRRRRARAEVAAAEAERQQQQEQAEEEATRKPGPLPIIVVLPDDGVAFGWEVPFREESLDSLDSLCKGDDSEAGRASREQSTSPV